MKKAPILLLCEYGVINGGENSLLAVLPRLQNKGLQFVAGCVPNSSLEKAFQRLGIRCHHLRFHNADGVRHSQEQVRNHLKQLILDVKPSVVHSNSLAMARLVGPLQSELSIPTVGYIRDILKLSGKAIRDINGNQKLIAVSQAVQRFHANQGVENEKLQVIYNGVDSKLFCPTECLDSDIGHCSQISDKVQTAKRSLLYVGQLGMRKGYDLLMPVFEKVSQQCKDLEMWIVGQRNSCKQEAIEMEKAVQQQVAASPFRNQISWLGRREDVPQLMRQASLLIHPARQEPLGRVLLEAAASGLPVVTTDVGGSREILGPLSEFGLVPKDDVQAMATKVLSFCNDQASAHDYGSSLRRRMLEKFSIEKCASQLADVYTI
ncbi:MAG: glycosyltransferase family 4 protein [Planctomycetota bacterium]